MASGRSRWHLQGTAAVYLHFRRDIEVDVNIEMKVLY